MARYGSGGQLPFGNGWTQVIQPKQPPGQHLKPGSGHGPLGLQVPLVDWDKVGPASSAASTTPRPRNRSNRTLIAFFPFPQDNTCANSVYLFKCEE